MEFFNLKEDDRGFLKKLIRSGASGHEVVRGMTLLLRDKGNTRSDIADTLEITPRTVTNTCSNYERYGIARAIKDDPRPGAPRTLSDRVKTKIVALVCSNPPEAFDRWTLELLKTTAEDIGIVDTISRESVRMILKEHDLKPWQQRMWCIPELDDEYIARMESILDIYESGDSEKRPLVCLDEKPVALFEDSRPAQLMEPGGSKKVDYEYIRNGTVNVFMAVEPFGGRYHTEVTENRKGETFAHFLKELTVKYKNAEKITLVMDNLNIHKETSLINAFGEKEGSKLWEKFDIHYTPKHASWLNIAEIAIGMYSRQCLGKTRIPSIKILKKKTESWEHYINKKKPTITWSFTKIDAREKMGYR